MIDPCVIHDPVGRVACHCGSPMVVRATSKYPHPDGSPRRFLGCARWPECDCTAALHQDGRLMSTPCDAATRQLRREAHAAFDALWKRQVMSRESAYVLLGDLLGLGRAQAHIGFFGADQCRAVIEHFADFDVAGTQRDVAADQRHREKRSRTRTRNHRRARQAMRVDDVADHERHWRGGGPC